MVLNGHCFRFLEGRDSVGPLRSQLLGILLSNDVPFHVINSQTAQGKAVYRSEEEMDQSGVTVHSIS